MTRSIFHGRIPPSSCRIYHEQRRSYDASKLGIDLWHEICAAPTAPDAPSTLEEVMQTTIKVDVRDSSAGQIFLDALLASLPLADVSGLGLHLPSEYLSSLWLPFAVFTRVSQLVVSPHPLVYSLFAALAPSPPDRASNTLRGQYPCSPSYLR
ncbi:hypothetical protein PsYK624_090230 [Phanerochaete sordida]|uniref:Uncharacterized protein n=1 Tax=Phanerochaete sordida TaxID=48140 RepID=A0A9P3GFM7_9APHY|nr:hypothetical protein PsYK624_090230 [Phanerochaete sordida]